MVEFNAKSQANRRQYPLNFKIFAQYDWEFYCSRSFSRIHWDFIKQTHRSSLSFVWMLNVVCCISVLNGTKLAPDKGPIDAMCKVMIMEPGKGKTNVFKTDVIKKTENPVWAATFKMTLYKFLAFYSCFFFLSLCMIVSLEYFKLTVFRNETLNTVNQISSLITIFFLLFVLMTMLNLGFLDKSGSTNFQILLFWKWIILMFLQTKKEANLLLLQHSVIKFCHRC